MFIYCVKNNIDNKVYVGASRRASFRKRIAEHKSRSFSKRDARETPLYCAIREHGWDAFSFSILEKCKTIKQLYAAEQRWIESFQSSSWHGYNLTSGGLGTPDYVFSESHRKKISEAHKGRIQSPEIIERRIAPQRGSKRLTVSAKLKGRTLSEEHKKNIGMASLGRKNVWSATAKENNRIAAMARAAAGVGAKLHPSSSASINKRRRNGESFASIARGFDVTPSTVFYFCKRHSI